VVERSCAPSDNRPTNHPSPLSGASPTCDGAGCGSSSTGSARPIPWPCLENLRTADAGAWHRSGLTLIEVLVSALVVTLIATAVAGALITNTDIIVNQNSRSQAETLAEQDQERLKGLSAEQLDNLSQAYNVTVGGLRDQLEGLVPE
jgi:hypothetical protein